MNGTQIIIDNTSTANVEYIGVAASGVLPAVAQWHIKKISYDTNGNLISIQNADGSADFKYAWDDRTILIYE